MTGRGVARSSSGPPELPPVTVLAAVPPSDPERDRAEAVGRAIAGAALVIMLGNVLSRALGLAREFLAAGRFGTGDPIAAFAIADQVHTLLFDLAVSGMLQAALIPVLAAWAVRDVTRAELRRIGGAILVLVLLVVGAAVLLGMIFAPWVVRGMTALLGDTTDRGPETVALTVTLVRWILPAVVLLAAGTVQMAVLHAVGRVTAPSLALAARNAAIVVAILLLSDRLGVRSLAVGTVAGAAAIVLLLVVPLRRADSLPRPNLGLGHPAVREVLRLYAPIFLLLLVNAGAVVVDRNLAWGAGEDALGAMRYATTLVQLVLGLVAAAISLAALPTLSRHHAAGDETAFRATLGRALAMTTLLIVPATLGLAAVAVPTVDLLFGHGATDDAGARAIVVALLGYLPGTLCAAYGQILTFAFYARRDTRTPVLVGLVGVGVYFLVAFPLVDALGMLGLVLANSAQFVAHLAMFWRLARRSFAPSGVPGLRRVIGRCTAAAAGMAALAVAVWLGLAAGLPAADRVWTGAARELGLVAVPIALGIVTYVAALHAWRLEELALLRRATVGRVVSSFPGRGRHGPKGGEGGPC